MDCLITRTTPPTDEVLIAIAHLPTKSLPAVVEPEFFAGLRDQDFMRIGVLLARKGYEEGGCPIGGVIVDNETRQIVGKGHNTLVQEGDPYSHGETAAIRDAGRRNFSLTTIFTTLSPCEVCATLIYMRQFDRVVVVRRVPKQCCAKKALRSISSKTLTVLRYMRSIARTIRISTWKTGRVWRRSPIRESGHSWPARSIRVHSNNN
jgi:cytosine deaminase